MNVGRSSPSPTHYSVPDDRRLIVDTGFLAQIGASALTDPDIEIPEADLESDTIPITYVPFRNADFLSLGVSWAETVAADAVYIGVVQEDSSGLSRLHRNILSGVLEVRPGRHQRGTG